MPEIIRGHLYDYPKYYDIIFGSDWKAEFDFLRACFARFAGRRVRRVFEPGCGTGRLLVRLAEAGYQVAGNDLNPHAVAYCNDRFRRRGWRPVATVGDMADFRLPRTVDAAFNMINTFRHLPDEAAARNHLRCVAEALQPGGLYLLGLHLTPVRGSRCEAETWSASRGHLSVVSHLWSKGLDSRRRREAIGMTFDVYTPSRQFRIVEETTFRTYTARQMAALLATVPELQPVATYDFTYDIEQPVTVGPETEDVVYVLRKTALTHR